MEIDHSERTNNARVIKYFNVQLFVFFPTSKFGNLIISQKFIHIVIKYQYTLKIIYINLKSI
jgi:hypothetical protein